MQNPKFVSRGKTFSKKLTQNENSFNQNHLQYPNRLNHYHDLPPEEISMEEFESFALDRLQLLKAIESSMLRNNNDKELEVIVREAMKKFMNLHPNNNLSQGFDLDAERKKDHISHYILRLAYCRSEDLRHWLVRHEALLFKYRWESCTLEERQAFLRDYNLEKIPTPERDALSALLKASSPYIKDLDMKTESFFKMPFERVPDLIGRREVYLQDGMAYIPQSYLISVILSDFKEYLMTALEVTARALPRMDDDDRLKPVLHNLSKHYLTNDYTQKLDGSLNNNQIGAEEVDKLSQHFPPCMRNLHHHLKTQQHLKHFGRMQFGLFLKGMGVPMEEALIYWRKAFSKLTDDQFQKNYSYNIRHNYGKEGKRVNYTPYSCMKIITTNQPSSGDYHGCPFKHFSQDNLQGMLRTHGLNDKTTKEVADLAKAGHYQVACTKYFEITRGKFNPHETETQHNMMDTISHPNHFFDLSLKMAGISLSKSEEKEIASQP